jgi:hypothetical protein
MKKIMLILLTLMAGCTSLQSNIATSTPFSATSWTQTPIYPIASVTPIKHPTIDQTHQSLQPISPEAPRTVHELLLNNGGCRFPCYWGIITPGKTKWEDAWISLESMADSFEKSGNFYTLRLKNPQSDYGMYYLYLVTNNDGIILEIRGSTGKYNIKTFFEEHGIPDEIFLEACGVCLEPVDHKIFLYYRNQGIWVASQISKNYGYARGKREITLCQSDFEKIGFPLKLWDPTLIHMSANPSEVFHTAWEVKSIQEATGLEREEFYDAIMNGDGNFCVYSDPEIWYP